MGLLRCSVFFLFIFLAVANFSRIAGGFECLLGHCWVVSKMFKLVVSSLLCGVLQYCITYNIAMICGSLNEISTKISAPTKLM